MNKKKKLILSLMLAMLIACVAGLSSCGVTEIVEKQINPITGEEVEDGNLQARPVIFSIPNAADGAVPQTGLDKADIIYEFPVEAQITRLQAVYYSQYPEYVGPIRSVRYYFVDLVREYQACHVGYGWGKKAHGYMHAWKIPHINGMQDTDLFERVDFKDAPNDAYIKWENVQKIADQDGWFNNTVEIQPWSFRDSDWEKEKENAQSTIDKKGDSDDPDDVKAVGAAKQMLNPDKASTVHVSSNECDSECRYDKDTGLYKRFWYDEPYVEGSTNKPLTFSNILVQYVHSELMEDDETGDVDAKGRIEINLQSGGDALLFTNGEVIKGTWSKADKDSRTIFVDEYGNEFRFSKGKTWCYVCDQNMKVEYK